MGLNARDSQRSKVYKAENVIRPLGKKFETVGECLSFVNRKVRKNAYVLRRYEKELVRDVEVRPGFGRRNASGSWNSITLPKWARTEAVILHEIAHVIQYRRYGLAKEQIQAHGVEFCQIFLDLVRACMGVAAHNTLKESFKANKVRITVRKKREISEEQRMALVARMAKVREARGKK